MNKNDLAETLRQKADLTQNQSVAVVDLFFNEISSALSRNDRVELRSLCSFKIKTYGKYTGRNPKTGKKVRVGKKRLPFFKCGKQLKERVNINY